MISISIKIDCIRKLFEKYTALMPKRLRLCPTVYPLLKHTIASRSL